MQAYLAQTPLRTTTEPNFEDQMLANESVLYARQILTLITSLSID